MKVSNRDVRLLLKEKYQLHELPEDKKSQVYDDLKRLKNGEPLDYVIGFKDFLGCKIDLSLKPLIPRPETEFWVNEFLSHSKILNRKSNILDLCCGSGCVGISVLKNFPNVHVDFVDIDSKALEQTKINLAINKMVNKQASVVNSNIFSNIKDKYDYILCNPPYVNPEGPYQKSIIFEPRIALFAKNKGLELIYKVLKEASTYLKTNGVLYLEFGLGQKAVIEKFCKKNKLNVVFNKDQYRRYRYLTFKNVFSKSIK